MRNIMEDIVRDYLDDFLLTRKDICTCHRCKMDMLAYTLSRVPAQYVTSDSGAVHTIINHARVEFQSKVLIQLLKAIEVISKEPRHELIEDEDKERAFGLLLDKVYEDRGLDFRHYRKRLLQRRVAVRMRAYNLSTYGDYLRILNTNPKEYEELFDVLTINVSEFFRDPIAWKAICDKMYIPLFEKKAKDNERFLRIWHAGCAKGEEPYSNAILIADLLPRLNITFSVEIIATDIDRTSLEIAQKGIYRKDNLKNVSQEYLEKYFETIDKNIVSVKKEIRQMVHFRQHDMIQDQPPCTGIDIIFCRNVFIYFMRSLQEQLIMTFYNTLKDKRYLILGLVESLLGEARTIFEEIDDEHRIYRKMSKIPH